MSSTVPVAAADQPVATASGEAHSTAAFSTLLLGSIGVVYGDIGTSPLYAFREAVTAALDEVEAALRGDDMPGADTALARAKTRLGDTGPDDLRGRLASLTRDRQMVETLEFIVDGQRTGRRLAVAAAIIWSCKAHRMFSWPQCPGPIRRTIS